MRIAGFEVQYLGHVCFLFTSPRGAVVATDPFFAKGFEWKGHFEKYLSPPAPAAADIRRCDAVFISHIHGDHCDPTAVRTIVGNTGAKVWAAPEAVKLLRDRGIPADNLVPLQEGRRKRLAGMTATACAGYDGSFDALGRPNKFALLLQTGRQRIFFSGDCHKAPPAIVGRTVDAVFAWPHRDDQELEAFIHSFRTRQYVLMHGDRFEPGSFWCNFRYEDHKPRIQRLAPEVEVIIPERVARLEP